MKPTREEVSERETDRDRVSECIMCRPYTTPSPSSGHSLSSPPSPTPVSPSVPDLVPLEVPYLPAFSKEETLYPLITTQFVPLCIGLM